MSLSSLFSTQYATLANDGDTTTGYSHCSHTDENKTIAWLQVDLGQSYSIYNVTMYYRDEREFLLHKITIRMKYSRQYNPKSVRITSILHNWQLINLLIYDSVSQFLIFLNSVLRYFDFVLYSV